MDMAMIFILMVMIIIIMATLMDIVMEITTDTVMDNKERKLVASKHAEVHPPGRSALSLRGKFASPQRIKHPTGDPNLPEEI